ncbi:hypothetical protein TKK_0019584 [Trichogramma kaykai]|uniref:Uncharacterized protein n=1 Tax=Trichogramma kaykai TaxID=54128 RepID=A0ABD2VRV1_9HYME
MEDSGIDSDPKITAHMDDDNAYAAGDSSSISSDDDHPHHHHAAALRPVGPLQQKFTTKQLQRKLEARIEQAKRIQRNSKYTKLPDQEPMDARQSSSQAEPSGSQLIPIKKLPIPMKKKKHNALVEIWHSDSDSEDELFPMTKKKARPKAEKKLMQPQQQHQQQQQQQQHSMIDAFSIEEMSEDDGSEDSLHLGSDSELHHRRDGYFGDCLACNCRVM